MIFIEKMAGGREGERERMDQEGKVTITRDSRGLDDFAFSQSYSFPAMLCWKGLKYRRDWQHTTISDRK